MNLGWQNTYLHTLKSGINIRPSFIDFVLFPSPKGQLILKCLFDTIVSTKKPTKFFLRISALAEEVKSKK